MKRVLVPVEPIAEAISEVVSELQAEWEKSPMNGQAYGCLRPAAPPVNAVAEQLARYTGRSIDGCQRTLYRIRYQTDHQAGGSRNTVRHVTVRLADEILCALDMVERWYTDPRLREVYETLGEEVAA